MKKILIALLLMFCLLGLVACGTQTEEADTTVIAQAESLAKPEPTPTTVDDSQLPFRPEPILVTPDYDEESEPPEKYPDLPEELSERLNDAQICQTEGSDAFVLEQVVLSRYREKEFFQSWELELLQGTDDSEGFEVTIFSSDSWLVYKGRVLYQVKLCGTSALISDSILCYNMPMGASSKVSAIVLEDGIMSRFRYVDGKEPEKSFVTEMPDEVIDASYGCGSFLIKKSDGIYIWKTPSWSGEENVYRFVQIGSADESIEDVLNDYHWYATYGSNYPTVSEFIAWCTTRIYSY